MGGEGAGKNRPSSSINRKGSHHMSKMVVAHDPFLHVHKIKKQLSQHKEIVTFFKFVAHFLIEHFYKGFVLYKGRIAHAFEFNMII